MAPGRSIERSCPPRCNNRTWPEERARAMIAAASPSPDALTSNPASRAARALFSPTAKAGSPRRRASTAPPWRRALALVNNTPSKSPGSGAVQASGRTTNSGSAIACHPAAVTRFTVAALPGSGRSTAIRMVTPRTIAARRARRGSADPPPVLRPRRSPRPRRCARRRHGRCHPRRAVRRAASRGHPPRVPARRTGADHRALRQSVDAVGTDQPVAYIGARQHRGDDDRLRADRLDILHRMHRAIDLAGEQGAGELLGPQRLAPDLGQRAVLHGVAGGLDDDDLAGQAVRPGQSVLDHVRLHQRERRAARTDANNVTHGASVATRLLEGIRARSN